MVVHDLGAIEAPILVFGGAYSNSHALGALFARAAQLGFDDAQLIHTGDAVAYGAAPQACVDMLAARRIACIAGNVERALALDEDACGCGFEDGSTCDVLARGWYGFARRKVSADARSWMAALPDRITFTHYGRRVVVLHGGASQIAKFVWPNAADTIFEGEIAQLGKVDIVLAGHCGLSFARQIGAVQWLNAGAIGMPENNGQPATRFGILTKDRFEILPLEYDHAAAASLMRRHGLVQGYEKALISGNWPSEDVLPISLRRKS